MANNKYIFALAFLSWFGVENITVRAAEVVEDQPATVQHSTSSRRMQDSQQNPAIGNVSSNEQTPVTNAIQPSPNVRAKSQWVVRQLMAALACVAVVCFAIVCVGKLQQSVSTSDHNAPLQLISTIRIAPRCCVTLVRANGRDFLVARDATGVKDIVSIEKSFDSYVADEASSTASQSPRSNLYPN